LTRILVAGGAGFIGSHLCRSLLNDDHDVICIDNLLTSTRANIEAIEDDPQFEFIEVDITDAAALADAGLPRADTIIHLASPASPIDYDRLPLETMAANSVGTWQLVDLARQMGATLLFVSTSEIYGDPLVHPQPETYWGNVDPIGPRACYDESKRFGEALIFSARRAHGIRANVVRFFNAYGPRMRRDDGRVIPEMISAAVDGRPIVIHGDGTQTRSFCYVSDLVSGLKHVLLDPNIDGQVFNIGNPDEITVRELAETIQRLLGADSQLEFVERRPGDPNRRRPIIDRMIERYGWAPRVGLEEGLARTFEAGNLTPAVRARAAAAPIYAARP
jgi:nucleoside-diphosphate-sugar epimerase